MNPRGTARSHQWPTVAFLLSLLVSSLTFFTSASTAQALTPSVTVTCSIQDSTEPYPDPGAEQLNVKVWQFGGQGGPGWAVLQTVPADPTIPLSLDPGTYYFEATSGTTRYSGGFSNGATQPPNPDGTGQAVVTVNEGMMGPPVALAFTKNPLGQLTINIVAGEGTILPNPLPAVELFKWDESGVQPVFKKVSSGQWNVTEVQPGTYYAKLSTWKVRYTAVEFYTGGATLQPTSEASQGTFTVTPNGAPTTATIAITSKAWGTVRGTVSGPDGPIKDFRVGVTSSHDRNDVDGQGNFVVESAAGATKLYISAEGYEEVTYLVTVIANQTVLADVKLRKKGEASDRAPLGNPWPADLSGANDTALATNQTPIAAQEPVLSPNPPDIRESIVIPAGMKIPGNFKMPPGVNDLSNLDSRLLTLDFFDFSKKPPKLDLNPNDATRIATEFIKTAALDKDSPLTKSNRKMLKSELKEVSDKAAKLEDLKEILISFDIRLADVNSKKERNAVIAKAKPVVEDLRDCAAKVMDLTDEVKELISASNLSQATEKQINNSTLLIERSCRLKFSLFINGLLD